MIGVACPYCMTMFEDGLKDEKAADKVVVKDIAKLWRAPGVDRITTGRPVR